MQDESHKWLLWMFVSILLTKCSGNPSLTVSHEGDGTTRLTCTAETAYSMQWQVRSSDLNLPVGPEQIDQSTRRNVTIADGITLSSTYLSPEFPQNIFSSIKSVMIISSSEDRGPIVFTCSGFTVLAGTFNFQETVFHQGSAPTVGTLPPSDPEEMSTDIMSTTMSITPSRSLLTPHTTSSLPITNTFFVTIIPTTGLTGTPTVMISSTVSAARSSPINSPSPRSSDPVPGEDNGTSPTATSPTNGGVFSRHMIIIIIAIVASTVTLALFVTCNVILSAIFYRRRKRSKSKEKTPDSSQEAVYDYPYQVCKVYGTGPINPVFELSHDQRHLKTSTELSNSKSGTVPMTTLTSHWQRNGRENYGIPMTQNAAYSTSVPSGNEYGQQTVVLL